MRSCVEQFKMEKRCNGVSISRGLKLKSVFSAIQKQHQTQYIFWQRTSTGGFTDIIHSLAKHCTYAAKLATGVHSSMDLCRFGCGTVNPAEIQFFLCQTLSICLLRALGKVIPCSSDILNKYSETLLAHTQTGNRLA